MARASIRRSPARTAAASAAGELWTTPVTGRSRRLVDRLLAQDDHDLVVPRQRAHELELGGEAAPDQVDQLVHLRARPDVEVDAVTGGVELVGSGRGRLPGQPLHE